MFHLSLDLPAPFSTRKLTNQALMLRAGQQAVALIKLRTMRGVDVNGQPFEPYSEGYAKAKQKYLGYAGTPNLTVSGEMLSGLTVIHVDDESATIGWVR